MTSVRIESEACDRRRRQRAEQGADPEAANSSSDLRGREALLAADDDHDEEQRLVTRFVQEKSSAQARKNRCPQSQRTPSATRRGKRDAPRAPLLLERRAHRDERDEREEYETTPRRTAARADPEEAPPSGGADEVTID